MKNHKKLTKWVIGLVLASIFITACGSASASGPQFPTGKFTLKTDQDIYYAFNGNKTWSYHYYGEIGAQGKYSIKGNLYTEKGTDECRFPGTYEWTFDGSNLTFKLVGEDKCDPRREATDGMTYVLQK